MFHSIDRSRQRLGIAVLFAFFLAEAAAAQVFVYRGKIDDSLIQGIGRRYKEVQVGDFNEDGWPDIYACQKQCVVGGQNCQPTSGTNKDRVYINLGTGDFTNLANLFTDQSQPPAFDNLITSRGYDVEVRDLDGDGHPDVVRPDVGRVDMLWGDGTGQFTPTNVITPANDPNGTGNYDDVAVLDIDIDGDFDILVAQYSGAGVNLLLRNRQQDGGPRIFDIETFSSADSTHTINAEDFNSDGIFDVAVARPGGISELMRGDPPACDPAHNFERFLSPPNSTDPTTNSDFTDLDGNGLLDLYVARGVFNDVLVGDERQHYVHFQTSPGIFSVAGAPVGAGDPSTYDARYADVDLDGNMEIIRANIHTNSQSSTLQAIRVHANRTFTDVTPAFFGGVWRGEMGVELADLDRDGDLDLVLAGSTDNTGNLSAGDAAMHIYENRTIVLSPGENRPPTAEPDFVLSAKDDRTSVPRGFFLGNDSDPDGDGLWYEYDLVTQMGGTNDTGHVGGFNYTPPPGFVGIDRMNYYLMDTPDGSGGEATGTITFIVTDPACATAQIQYGTATIDEIIRTVTLSGFTNPIVVMGPPSFNGGQPTATRVRNVTAGSFQQNIQEWDYLDGNHINESIGYLALEAGTTTLGFLKAEAGSRSVGTGWTTVTFDEPFKGAPVVVAQIGSFDDPAAVTTRVRNVTGTGFQVRIQEEEAADGVHAAETVYYVAIAPGSTTVDGNQLVVGTSGDTVTHAFRTVNFGTAVSGPALIAHMQTTDGGNTAALRYQSLTSTSFQVKVEEEQSADSEVNHTTENVGYIILGN